MFFENHRWRAYQIASKIDFDDVSFCTITGRA